MSPYGYENIFVFVGELVGRLDAFGLAAGVARTLGVGAGRREGGPAAGERLLRVHVDKDGRRFDLDGPDPRIVDAALEGLGPIRTPVTR